MNPQAQGAELLRLVDSVLKEAGVHYWLDQGTLLGAVRDGALLPWDTDIDLSMWAEDFRKVLQLGHVFQAHGVNLEFHERRSAAYLTLKRRSSLYIDIAPHWREGNQVRKRFSKPRSSKAIGALKRIVNRLPPTLRDTLRKFGRSRTDEFVEVLMPGHWFSDFEELDFLGMRPMVPTNTRGYLAFKYGPDWMTPRRDWNFYQEDGATRSNLSDGLQ